MFDGYFRVSRLIIRNVAVAAEAEHITDEGVVCGKHFGVLPDEVSDLFASCDVFDWRPFLHYFRHHILGFFFLIRKCTYDPNHIKRFM